MDSVAKNLLDITGETSGILATKIALENAIERNLGRTIPTNTSLVDYADYILPPVAWMPDPLWASLTDIADGQIGMIVRDRDDLGVAARCAFTITATAAYVVDWGDGTAPETVASTVMADHTYTLGAGTADSKGTTTFKVRISSTGTITRILMASNVTGGVVKQTVQSVNIKAAGITNMYDAFRHCYLLQACTMVALQLCTTFANAFYGCTELNAIGDITADECISVASILRECPSLMSVGNIHMSKCTAFENAFVSDMMLRSIGDIYAPLCASINTAFFTCRNLQSIGDISGLGSSATSVDCDLAFHQLKYSGSINLSSAKISKIRAYGVPTRLSGITGLTFHASSAFGGSSPQIDVQYTMMDRTALVALFNLLPTLTGKTINVTGCIGTADLTADDRAIATGKGWTITG